MKTLLLALCLFACSLSLPAQSNTSPVTAEQRMEQMRKNMEASVARAQQQALERQARLATNPQPPIDTNPIVRVSPPHQSYFNTNDHRPGIGDTIRDFEKLVPGFSTNFLPSQLALTNAHRNIIYRTNGLLPTSPPSLRQ